jgi:hypothetical protein
MLPKMKRRAFLTLAGAAPIIHAAGRRRTEVSIQGDRFFLNGKPTYRGRSYKGMKIEGLLMNVRAVQGIFDDLNPETRGRWAYPDTGKWDPDRNTRELVAALPEWRRHGVLAVTINLQGGSPEGYSKAQPWENSAIDPEGNLRGEYMDRLAVILDRADELGMVVIVGYFYFGQDRRVQDEAAVRSAVSNATTWLLDHGYRNILVEVNNESNVAYHHDILKPARVDELIEMVKGTQRNGHRLPAGTSYGGGAPATANVIKASDFLLLHGNGPDNPARIREMIQHTRKVETYRSMPVLINEDDHFRFAEPDNNMLTALSEYVSWGFFDPGKNDYSNGFQCPPVNWSINTDLKKQFFAAAKEVTGV